MEKIKITEFKKLNEVGKTSIIIGGLEIEVLKYVPIETKTKLILDIIKESFYVVKETPKMKDNKRIYDKDGKMIMESGLVYNGLDSVKFDIISKYLIFKSYVTNISFPQKDGNDDILAIYDTINCSGAYNGLLQEINDAWSFESMLEDRASEEPKRRELNTNTMLGDYFYSEVEINKEELINKKIVNQQSSQILKIMSNAETIEDFNEMSNKLSTDVENISKLKNYGMVKDYINKNDTQNKISKISEIKREVEKK